MPTKTLYVKDQQLWEKASRLAGHQGLSGVVAQLLAKWVADKEKQEAMKSGKEFTEIELWVGGNTGPYADIPHDQIKEDHKIVFVGRLIGSSTQYVTSANDLVPVVEVYQMKSGRLVVYKAYRDYSDATDQEYQATYKVFSNFEDLQQSSVFSDYEKMLDEHWEDLGAGLSALAAEDEEKFVEKIAEVNLQFQRDIASALSAELVVRID